MRLVQFLIIIMLFISIFFSNNAAAQNSQREPAYDPPGAGWIKVLDFTEGVSWIHPGTAQRNGPLVEIWFLTNFKRGHQQCLSGGQCAASRRGLGEIDCRGRRVRALETTSYSGINAQGRVISEEKRPDDWSRIPPDSPEEQVMNIVCTPNRLPR